MEIARTNCKCRVTPTSIESAELVRELLICQVSAVIGREFLVDGNDAGVEDPVDDGGEKPTEEGKKSDYEGVEAMSEEQEETKNYWEYAVCS